MRAYLLSLTLSAALMPTLGCAAADIPTEALVDYVEDAQAHVSNQALPMGRLMVSTRGNTTAIMSDNGRYKFSGPIIDTWLGIEIKSYEDALYSSEHLSLQNLKFRAEYLDPLVWGEGAQRAMVFLSPDDPNSRAFLSEASKHLSLYTFDLIVIPSKTTPLGLAHAFACPSDASAAMRALLSNNGYDDLRAEDGCNYDKLTNRILASNMLGFDDLPAVLTPSTRLAVGAPSDGKSWAQFLMENTL